MKSLKLAVSIYFCSFQEVVKEASVAAQGADLEVVALEVDTQVSTNIDCK